MDGDPSPRTQRTGHLEGLWPGAVGPGPRPIDRDRVAGERADDGQDDAAV